MCGTHRLRACAVVIKMCKKNHEKKKPECGHMAPAIYDKAMDGAQRWYELQMEKLEADYYLLYHDMQ